MSDHRASSHADRRLLLVVIQGLDRTDLELGAALHLESLRDHTLGAAALDAPGAPPVVDQLLTALDVPALRSSGLSVCQRSVVLRPDWQDDRSNVDLLLRRVGGPADLTLLWLRDAAHAAVTGGRHCDGHRSALRRTDGLVREVHHALGQGARDVGVAVCGAAALAPVELSHDPRPLLRRALDRRDARRATVRVALSHAVLHCPSWPARQHAAARLRSDAERLIVIDAPAPDLAASLDLRPGDLLCVPPLGQAFATAPVRARTAAARRWRGTRLPRCIQTSPEVTL